MKKLIGFLGLLYAFLLFPQNVFAHEAYVLTHQEFQQGLMTFTTNPLGALFEPAYRQTSAIITICVVFGYILSFLWSATPWAEILDKAIKKVWVVGPFLIRLAICSSFFYAAASNSILGPELSLTTLPGGMFIRFLLFALSVMIFFGFLTEVAAAIGLLLFFYVSAAFGLYMITYANYFGELIVLALFGSRFFSLDALFFGQKRWLSFFQTKQYIEIPIVRVLYAVALIYAGWNIKFLHQSLSVEVYNQYHLINFFHASASFIAAGAGLSEILIGLFILLGFAQRLTVCISLVFITLSIFYFRELLWPHFMLYGISFSLFINSADTFTIDHYLVRWIKQLIFRKTFKKK